MLEFSRTSVDWNGCQIGSCVKPYSTIARCRELENSIRSGWSLCEVGICAGARREL